MTDRIEKSIAIAAPVERVWRALTDHEEFGAWFRVELEGPFVLGELSRGRITYSGYEHLKWEARVVAMEAPRLFAFTWHPYAVDPDKDYSADPRTRVEFRLEPSGQGTNLIVVESGFDSIPAARREEALRMNTSGWETQVKNVKAHAER
ncbi:MAG: SRPBCC family protein [Allosphingosinicella sp.]